MNYRLTKFNASVEDRNNLIGDEVTVRILVASQFGSEEELFRSQVVAIEGRQAKLFFADFGDCSAQPVPTLATPGCALLPCRTISQGHGVARRGAHADRQRPGALGHVGGGGSLPWTSSMPGTHLPQLRCQHTYSSDCISNALYDVVLPPSLMILFTNGVFLHMYTYT